MVGSYYMDLEAGIFQLAFNIRAKMLKAQVNCIPKKAVQAVTAKVMKRRAVKGAAASTKDPQFYFGELVRRGFLKPDRRGLVKPSSTEKVQSAIMYRFPMAKVLEFSYFKN